MPEPSSLLCFRNELKLKVYLISQKVGKRLSFWIELHKQRQKKFNSLYRQSTKCAIFSDCILILYTTCGIIQYRGQGQRPDGAVDGSHANRGRVQCLSSHNICRPSPTVLSAFMQSPRSLHPFFILSYGPRCFPRKEQRGFFLLIEIMSCAFVRIA